MDDMEGFLEFLAAKMIGSMNGAEVTANGFDISKGAVEFYQNGDRYTYVHKAYDIHWETRCECCEHNHELASAVARLDLCHEYGCTKPGCPCEWHLFCMKCVKRFVGGLRGDVIGYWTEENNKYTHIQENEPRTAAAIRRCGSETTAPPAEERVVTPEWVESLFGDIKY